ncbi:hypothetical protein AWC21_01600 [Mycolicibacterium peregrinum]|nr:hypothetical protein AWC21_01600 [Mycolicibacterium peregrinum]
MTAFDAPVGEDDAYWIRMGDGHRWTFPNLSAPDVAALLGIADPADLAVGAPGLPAPDGDGQWSRRQVYEYILVHRTDREFMVPRLYPITPALGPARFLFGQVVGRMAVHAWQPTDGRGPIAVAYCGRDVHEHELIAAAEGLLQELPWATAVCCPSRTTKSAADRAIQPFLVVAEHHERVNGSAGWFDIGSLLRVDVPWWSERLRDLEAIASWRPGAPVQRLRAQHTLWPDPHDLAGLVAASTPEYVRQVVDRAIEYLDWDAAKEFFDSDGHDELPARRGLIHGAVADIDPGPAPVGITAGEATLLLHQPCADPTEARKYLRLLEGRWLPVNAVYFIARDRVDSLAAEWFEHLTPVPEAAAELGFAYVRREAGSEGDVYRDRRNPDSWVVVTDDTVYVAVSWSVPAAGQLTELHFKGPLNAFFRDSRGQVWPLPWTGRPAGTGPHGGEFPRKALRNVVTNLVLDAAGDVRRPVVPNLNSLLARRINGTDAPLVIAPGDPALAVEDHDRRSVADEP